MPRNPPAWGGRVGTRGWHCRERPRCRANGAPGPKPAAHESLGSAAGGASDWREQAPGGIVMADPPGKIREALSRFQQVLAHPRRARETPPPLRDVGQTAGCLSRFGLKTAFPLGSSPVSAVKSLSQGWYCPWFSGRWRPPAAAPTCRPERALEHRAQPEKGRKQPG